MKYILLFVLSLIFCGCKTTNFEVYNVEKCPVSFQDTIYYKPEHWHFKDQDDKWVCVDLDADTTIIDFQDTMCLPIYKGNYKQKKYIFN